MNPWDKLVIHPSSPEINFTFDDGRSFTITRTKYDDLLLSFATSDSLSSRFVSTTAEVDILRTFLFLEGSKHPQVNSNYPMAQFFPLVLNPQYNLTELLSGAFRTKSDEADKKSKESRKTLSETMAAASFDFFGDVLAKPQTLRSLSNLRKAENRRKTIEQLFLASKEESLKMIATWVDIGSNLVPELNQLSGVTENVALYPVGVKNAEVLATRVKLPEAKQALFAELERLASSDIVQIGTKSFCLDCYFSHSRQSYGSTQSNIHSFSLPNICPTCRGEGIVHQVVFEYPRGLHQFILPQSNWLQEIIIGYTVAQLPQASKVYVHKILHQNVNGTVSQGVEADVVLVTNDKRMFIIEVTTQTDADNVLREFVKKRDRLNQIGIKYDGLAYVTACPTFQGYHTIDERSRVFGAHHLADLNKFLATEFKL
jgi:hypothetical protein